MRKKLQLAHKPTPIVHYPQLDELLGTEVWVKRDDMTGGAEAGNKLRKLEYLVADALNQGANVLITCGGAQSNHARATALTARRFGLDCVVLLRSQDPDNEPETGNLRLMRLAGAEVIFITPAEYAERNPLMEGEAERLRAEGKRPYVIPEGGSNGLGALGYVDAVREIAEQQALGLCPKNLPIVCACGSGGTAAGLALGAGTTGAAEEVIAAAVCDDRQYFESVTEGIIADAMTHLDAAATPAKLRIVDDYKGPAYAVMSPEQLEFLTAVVRCCGLVLDPTYSGKALFALSRLDVERALFIHTGGLPGLLA